MAGFAAFCAPAAAQVYWGDSPQRYRNPGYQGYQGGYQESPRYQESPQRDYFGFPFFGDRYNRPSQPVDSSKAPTSRKLETPPASTVVVIGDSMADWLAYGLDETYSDQPDVGFERKIRATSGLIRYDAKNEALEWPQSIKDALASEKPTAIIVMLGINDRVPIRDKTPPKPEPPRKPGEPAAAAATAPKPEPPHKAGEPTAMTAQPAPDKQEKPAAAPPSDSEAAPQDAAAADAQHPVPGTSYDFHTDQWATLYAKHVDDMIAALKTKGVPIIWVGLPALKGTKSTNEVSYLDELYRERAEKAGITYVDIWDGFVDDQGRYTVQGPDFEGQTRRLRTGDGTHFTKAGAVKLASYVDRDLRRILNNHVTPVALPAPDTAAPKSGGGRPDVGPVLPLTATGSGEGGDLLGAGARPPQMTSDPVAAKVLGRGDPIPAPTGRSDDFSWPRPGNETNAADLAPEPVSLTPSAAKKGPPGKNDTKKAADTKDTRNDAKNKSAPSDNANSKSRRSPSASLDGAAPRPPRDVGGGF
jgi:uncharacterized protein